MPDNFDSILDSLANDGWAVEKNFLENELSEGLLKECNQLYTQGGFKKAGIGKGQSQQVVNEIRGDNILWFDEQTLLPYQQLFYNKINNLQEAINRDFYLGIKEFECHFAIYPTGSFYKRHLDRFENTQSRQISCILYLNQGWQEGYGGQLRLYIEKEDKESFYDIKPEWGTFACFKSDIAHEVLPTTKERYSITGWLKN